MFDLSVWLQTNEISFTSSKSSHWRGYNQQLCAEKWHKRQHKQLFMSALTSSDVNTEQIGMGLVHICSHCAAHITKPPNSNVTALSHQLHALREETPDAINPAGSEEDLIKYMQIKEVLKILLHGGGCVLAPATVGSLRFICPSGACGCSLE